MTTWLLAVAGAWVVALPVALIVAVTLVGMNRLEDTE